jgi:hypothetical protein
MFKSMKPLLLIPLAAASVWLVFTSSAAPAQSQQCPGSLNAVQNQSHLGAFGFACKFRLQEFTARGSKAIAPRAIGEDFTCRARSARTFHCHAPFDGDGNLTSAPFGKTINGLLRSRGRVCGEHPLRVGIDATGVPNLTPGAPRLGGTAKLKARC